MQAMSLNFALAQKENTSFTVDISIIFHINDILKNLTLRVSNYMHIDFPYSTVTSACQGRRVFVTKTNHFA